MLSKIASVSLSQWSMTKPRAYRNSRWSALGFVVFELGWIQGVIRATRQLNLVWRTVLLQGSCSHAVTGRCWFQLEQDCFWLMQSMTHILHSVPGNTCPWSCCSFLYVIPVGTSVSLALDFFPWCCCLVCILAASCCLSACLVTCWERRLSELGAWCPLPWCMNANKLVLKHGADTPERVTTSFSLKSCKDCSWASAHGGFFCFLIPAGGIVVMLDGSIPWNEGLLGVGGILVSSFWAWNVLWAETWPDLSLHRLLFI